MKPSINSAPRRPTTSTACCNPTVFVKDKAVADRDKIQMDLIKLAGGERLLRLTETESGLSLEKKLDANLPILGQKERLLGVFEAALVRAELSAA